jgi:hypothetical protein
MASNHPVLPPRPQVFQKMLSVATCQQPSRYDVPIDANSAWNEAMNESSSCSRFRPRVIARVFMFAAFASSTAPAFAAESSCEPVFAAADATARTPHHAYVTVLLLKGMPPQSSEL